MLIPTDLNSIYPLLQKLAVGLGTTANMIFGVYLRQVYIDAWWSAILASIAFVCSIFLIGFGFFSLNDDDTDTPSVFVGFIFGSILMCVFGSILMCVSFSNIKNSIDCFLNPQYAAMHDIMSDLGNK